MRRAPGLIVIILVGIVMAAAPVDAHVLPRAPAVVPSPALTETLMAAAPAPAMPWAVLGAVVTVALLAAWRPRRVVALALVLVVGIFAFETGLHSTHHLGRPDGPGSCTVAGLSAQICADLVDVTLDIPRAEALDTQVSIPAGVVLAARVAAPDAGRAPPVLPA